MNRTLSIVVAVPTLLLSVESFSMKTRNYCARCIWNCGKNIGKFKIGDTKLKIGIETESKLKQQLHANIFLFGEFEREHPIVTTLKRPSPRKVEVEINGMDAFLSNNDVSEVHKLLKSG